MFDIEICSSPPVILIRFRGELTDDFLALTRMAAEPRAGVEYDSIFNFSNVERLDLATEFVARLAANFRRHSRAKSGSMWSRRMT